MKSLIETLDLDYPGDYAKQAIEKLRTKQNIILFGAAEYGKIIGDYLKENGIFPRCYCDNNENKIGSTWNDMLVICPQEIKEDDYIVITCNAYREVEKQVNALGCHNVMYFNVNWVRFPNGKRKFILDNLDLFEQTYQMLEDEKSKKTFINLLNYKITYKTKYTEEIVEPEQYFDDDIYKLPENYVFLDAGSYIGDTVQALIGHGDAPGKIICMEPMNQNIEKLQRYIELNHLDYIDVYQCAASDQRSEEYFETANGMAARRSDTDGQLVICDSIDNICIDKYPKIDIIKMDIEGAEVSALKGAKKIIQRDKPVLAICVYHKEDDFYTIPALIKKLNPEYKLYFRQYELSEEETVCYAVM